MSRPPGSGWRAEPWAMFCMAIWLTGTVCVAIVATQNFFTIDRLLANSPNNAFHVAVDTLDSVKTPGHPVARDMLRYLSAELNRLYFQYWNLAQMAVGILTLWLVMRIRGAERAKWCIVGMLGISLFVMAVLTPPIVSVGRSLDFVPRDSPPPEVVSALRTFGLLHATYTVSTLITLVLGVLATIGIQKPKES
ncbi:MAG TPA: hypothetical protein VK210_00380 [Terriglobia bacterium]|nr:hypothetical protein [Terriglobia bacterium]